jgi:hypothetical protein
MYSIEKYSIVRRAALHLEIRVRKEFRMDNDNRLDSTKVFAHYDGNIPAIPDLWDIVICEPSEHTTNNLHVINYHASIFDVIEICTTKSRQHFANQANVVAMSADLDEKLDYCDVCHLPGCMCTCPPAAQPVQHVPEDMPVLVNQAGIEQTVGVKDLCTTLDTYDTTLWSWTNWVPSSAFDNKFFNIYLALCSSDKIIETVSLKINNSSTSFSYLLLSFHSCVLVFC